MQREDELATLDPENDAEITRLKNQLDKLETQKKNLEKSEIE